MYRSKGQYRPVVAFLLLMLVLSATPHSVVASARLRQRGGHCIPRKIAAVPQQPLIVAETDFTVPSSDPPMPIDTLSAGNPKMNLETVVQNPNNGSLHSIEGKHNPPPSSTSHQVSLSTSTFKQLNVSSPLNPTISSSSNDNYNNNNNLFQPCEISVYTYDSSESCNKIFNEFGACGLSVYYPFIMKNNLPRLALPKNIFDKYGKSQHNKLCGSKSKTNK